MQIEIIEPVPVLTKNGSSFVYWPLNNAATRHIDGAEYGIGINVHIDSTRERYVVYYEHQVWDIDISAMRMRGPDLNCMRGRHGDNIYPIIPLGTKCGQWPDYLKIDWATIISKVEAKVKEYCNEF